MVMALFSRVLVGSLAVFAFLMSPRSAAVGQTTADTPKLDQPFTFTLQGQREHALGDFVNSLRNQDELRRRDELESINQPVLSKALDLLRYLPISLGGSDGDEDDFSLPAYLQPGYARVPPDAHLFDTK